MSSTFIEEGMTFHLRDKGNPLYPIKIKIKVKQNRNRCHYDEDMARKSISLIQVLIGPVTRSRTKQFKEVLNGLVQ